MTAFTCTIARNFAISRLRARRSRPDYNQDYDVHDPVTAPPASLEDDPLERVLVKRALAHLNNEERQLMEASFYSGYSHQELCERYNMPLGSLKSKLRRALLKLRAVIGTA